MKEKKRILKRVFSVLLSAVVLLGVFLIPISASEGQEEYTIDTINHLSFTKICDIFQADNVVEQSTGCFWFQNVKGGIVDSQNEWDNTFDFHCGTLCEFMPHLEVGVFYYISMAEGYLCFENGRRIEALDSFTFEELNTPVIWKDVTFWLDVGSDVILEYPMVVKGSSTGNFDWRPFYDTVSFKSEEKSVWEKYPTLNILPYDYQHVGTTKYGVTFTVKSDGVLVLNGTVKADKGYASFVFLDNAKIPMPNKVTLSAFTGGSKETYYIQPVFSGKWGKICTGTYTYETSGQYLEKVVFYAMNGFTFVNFEIKPMLNYGDVAYPFQPYLKYHFDSSFQEGYDNGYTEGNVNGYGLGYVEGNLNGYNVGYSVGQEEGYNSGYDIGYETGYDKGESTGYNVGFAAGEQSDVSKNIKSLISEIVFAPYRAISTMFDFEIFGINIAGAIFTIFTLVVILLVIGFIVKMVL